MWKRLEIYADAGLLGLVFGFVTFLLLALGPARFLMRFAEMGLRVSASIAMIGPAAIIGAVLGIWASWALHRRTTSEPIAREDSRRELWMALGLVIVVPALVAVYALWGTASMLPGLIVAAGLLALGAALVVDALRDLRRGHEHRALDFMRVVLIVLLGFALVASLAQPAQPGTDQDLTPFVVVLSAYMLLVALIAFGWDEFESHRVRVREARIVPGP